LFFPANSFPASYFPPTSFPLLLFRLLHSVSSFPPFLFFKSYIRPPKLQFYLIVSCPTWRLPIIVGKQLCS
jgi:hypothetical protein